MSGSRPDHPQRGLSSTDVSSALVTPEIVTTRMHSAGIWFISLASIALVLTRPKGWPEAIWATAGAALLVVCRLISPLTAGNAVRKGLDVYLFLTGMMIMSELARREG